MRVLIVNRHFGNDQVPTARMAHDLAQELTRNQHRVVLLTSKSAYVSSGSDTANVDGIEVHHVYTFGDKNRLISWCLFLLQAWLRIPLMRWDRCVLMTDPPFLAFAASLFPNRVGKRACWWTMDLYPEMLVQGGWLQPSSRLNRFLRWMNNRILANVAGVVLLGKCQVQKMRQYSRWNERRHIVVPPWDYRSLPKVSREKNRFLQKYSLDCGKIALYAGNLGEGHTFTPIVDAARFLVQAGRKDWMFVFVIRGTKKRSLEAAAECLSAIRILDYQPPDWTPDLLWSADLHLITMNADSKGLVVPSKLYGVLNVEAPVLFVGPPDADTASEIEKYDAGTVLPEDCAGKDVIATMDRLYDESRQRPFARTNADRTGPRRIREFIEKFPSN